MREPRGTVAPVRLHPTMAVPLQREFARIQRRYRAHAGLYDSTCEPSRERDPESRQNPKPERRIRYSARRAQSITVTPEPSRGGPPFILRQRWLIVTLTCAAQGSAFGKTNRTRPELGIASVRLVLFSDARQQGPAGADRTGQLLAPIDVPVGRFTRSEI